MYVFHGHGSRYANAVFSSVEQAKEWARRWRLTGLLTRYEVDDPAFDRLQKAGRLPANVVDDPSPWRVQVFCEGGWHEHFVEGMTPEDDGFDDAMKRLDREPD